MSLAPWPQRPGPGRVGAALSPLARLVLWDYPRGSLAYDLLWLALLVLLLLAPSALWRDPMVVEHARPAPRDVAGAADPAKR